ncbi:MAG: hypothetical protein PUH24_00850 [Prevotellaceae bacterium]|nr:hypothetical protein [Prevotellaceae bacterium]MDY6131667.1 hypothetical protein [Prevotella sp.]
MKTARKTQRGGGGGRGRFFSRFSICLITNSLTENGKCSVGRWMMLWTGSLPCPGRFFWFFERKRAGSGKGVPCGTAFGGWFVVFPFIIRCPTRNHRPVCNGIIHWRATDGALLRQEWCVGALGAVLCMHCGFRAVGKRATFSEKRKERREKEDKT